MSALTPRQSRILEFLRAHVAEHGYPPSMREVGDACGLTSSSSVAHQLKVLEEKGYVRRDPNHPRALTIVAAAPDPMSERERIISCMTWLLDQEEIDVATVDEAVDLWYTAGTPS